MLLSLLLLLIQREVVDYAFFFGMLIPRVGWDMALLTKFHLIINKWQERARKEDKDKVSPAKAKEESEVVDQRERRSLSMDPSQMDLSEDSQEEQACTE